MTSNQQRLIDEIKRQREINPDRLAYIETGLYKHFHHMTVESLRKRKVIWAQRVSPGTNGVYFAKMY